MDLTPLTIHPDVTGEVAFTFLDTPQGERVKLVLKPRPDIGSHHPVRLEYLNPTDHHNWEWGYPGIPAFRGKIWGSTPPPMGTSKEAATILKAILEGDSLLPLFVRYLDFRRKSADRWRNWHLASKWGITKTGCWSGGRRP